MLSYYEFEDRTKHRMNCLSQNENDLSQTKLNQKLPKWSHFLGTFVGQAYGGPNTSKPEMPNLILTESRVNRSIEIIHLPL